MCFNLVDSESHVATSPIVEQEIADRGMLKPDWFVFIVNNIDDGMKIT